MRPHENKEYGIVLDNAGLWKEYGLPKMERNWSLTGTDKNICPFRKEIIGIKENISPGNNEPKESRGIRLVEIGELDEIILSETVNYNNIEKNLTDKSIHTMRERIEKLLKKIQKFQQDKNNALDEEDTKIFDEIINRFQKELSDLQKKFQPERFEQVIGLMVEKCQELIDDNDIFVDGDKDNFLSRFVEPYLKSNNSNGIRETAVIKSENQKHIQENPMLGESQNEVHHKKAEHTKLKVTFPNGQIINDNEAINTFIKTIQEFGFDKVQQMSVSGGISIISDKADNGLKKEFKPILNTPFYINSNNSTEAKKKLIEKIAKMLSTEIKVEILPK